MMQMLMGCFQFCCDGVVKDVICVSCCCAGMSLLSVVVVLMCWLFVVSCCCCAAGTFHISFIVWSIGVISL